jgi:5-methylcytosine-specific restriction endonuclease McrA
MRHLAIYGSVKILRDLCPECKEYAFILRGRFACCGAAADLTEPASRYKRMSQGDGSRNLPPLEQRRAVLKAQENRCFYCDRIFGFRYRTKRGTRPLCVEWDHLVPYAYLNSSPDYNFVAACRECNRIKGAIMFQTIEEAIVYVRSRVWSLQESEMRKDLQAEEN